MQKWLARAPLAGALLSCVLAGTTARAAAESKPLAELNELSKILGSKVQMGPGELDVAQVVAVRDQVQRPTPMTIGYAAAVEKSLKAGELKPDKGNRVLLDLALALAPLGGPDAESLEEAFLPQLSGALGIKPADLKPRPTLGRELAEVGDWALATVLRLAPTVGAELGDEARWSALTARGRHAEAASVAKKRLGQKADPRWRARLGAALLEAGKAAEARPHVAAALGAGGEAANIVRVAQVRRTHRVAIEHAGRALKAAGFGVLTREAGGRERPIVEACKKLFAGKDAHEGLGDATLACATVLWSTPDRSWVPRAAELAPAGAAGAPVRAMAALLEVFQPGGERAAALARYQAELEQLSLDPLDRTVLALLGHMASAEDPSTWSPSGPADSDERVLLGELESKGYCFADGFALRAVAARKDRAQLGKFLRGVIERCGGEPGGAAITADAIGLALQLAHEEPVPAALSGDALEPLVIQFARAHEDDAEAVGVHADAVALKALSGKPSAAGLAAALARYEQAIARWTPEGGGPLRRRLETNAGYLSLALARLTPEKPQPSAKAGEAKSADGKPGEAKPADGKPEDTKTAEAKPADAKDKPLDPRTRLYLRAAGHLRQALALGEIPALTASRAAYDLETGTGTTITTLDLPHMAPGRGRARAACMLASQASERGDRVVTAKLLELAKQKGASEHHPTVSELLVDTSAQLSALLEERTLRPFVELHTSLYLAPPCDASDVALPIEQGRKPTAAKH